MSSLSLGGLSSAAPPAGEARAGGNRPATAPAGTESPAAALFLRRCARCHGEDGRGSAEREVPDFTRHAWQQRRDDFQLVVSILDGKGGQMPAFGGRISEGQARELVAHIRSFDPQRAAADPPDDFEVRMRELRKEWEDLRRQFRNLGDEPRAGRERAPGPDAPADSRRTEAP